MKQYRALLPVFFVALTISTLSLGGLLLGYWAALTQLSELRLIVLMTAVMLIGLVTALFISAALFPNLELLIRDAVKSGVLEDDG